MSDDTPKAASPAATPPLGYFPFKLPSRGRFYVREDGTPFLDEDGTVQLRPFKAKEQAQLQQAGGGLPGKLNTIVSTCLQPIPGLDPQDLLMVDRFACLIALRSKTFGSKYQIDFKCRECGAKNTTTIDISDDFDEITPEPGLTEPFEIELPVSGQTLHCRFLRGRDEAQVARHAKRFQMQSNDADDPSYLYRLALQVAQIEGEEAPIIKRQKFIEDLHPSDLIHLEDRINELEPGYDTRVYPECQSCGEVNAFPMPLQGEFFRPGRRR